MTLVTAACAVCGGSDFSPLYPGNIPQNDSDPASYFSSSRAHAGHWPIVRCRNCGMVMANPRDDAATLVDVYARLRDTVYDGDDDNRRRTAQAYLALIQKHCPRPGRLLDIGCATGIFACAAQAAGWQTTGLDSSAWSIDRARKRCPQATFADQALEQAEYPAAAFEVITLWDVLEHVASPADALLRVRRWLVPGGWLFLNLPNAASLIALGMGRRWVLFLREHLWYFSPGTMRQLLERHGFELIRTRPNFVHFSVANIGGRLAQYSGVAGWAGRVLMAQAGLRRVSLQFPMGEMNVVARKSLASVP